MNQELIVILASVLGICVLLPAFCVWMISRRKMYEAKRRSEIALAILREKPDTSLDELVDKLTPAVDPRLRLLPLLWVGLVSGIVALSLGAVLSVVEIASRQGFIFLCFVTAVCAAISIPSMICYLVGSRRRK